MNAVTNKMRQLALNDGWSEEEINAGYVICDNGNGNLHIERIDILGKFDTDEEAAQYAATHDGIALLPLPTYLDTPKNRKDLSKKVDRFLLSKWDELSDIPFADPGVEFDLILEEDWWIFPKGTERETIWHYFDCYFSVGVVRLLYRS